jgi:hypothetical protein
MVVPPEEYIKNEQCALGRVWKIERGRNLLIIGCPARTKLLAIMNGWAF